MSNTPSQINILRALEADLPVYAHVPNINGEDGKKLSKRHGAISVDVFRDDGYLPAALMNFLALLGWSYDDKTTIMSRHELIERFTLERVVPSPATFDYKKLDWMNGMYLRALQPGGVRALPRAVVPRARHRLAARAGDATVPLVQEKIEKFSQYPDFVRFLFEDVQAPDGVDGRVAGLAADRLAQLSSWDAAAIEADLRGLVEELGEKPRTAFAPIRLAVTGRRCRPGCSRAWSCSGVTNRCGASGPRPPERPRPRERVECALKRLPGLEPKLRCRDWELAAGRPRVRARDVPFPSDKRRGTGGGYGRYARTDAHTASDTGRPRQAKARAWRPATNASAPTSASRNATSGPCNARRPELAERLLARCRRREAKPREPDSEQRAAPLGQQRLDGFGALVGQRFGHLGGGVARSGK